MARSKFAGCAVVPCSGRRGRAAASPTRKAPAVDTALEELSSSSASDAGNSTASSQHDTASTATPPSPPGCAAAQAATPAALQEADARPSDEEQEEAAAASRALDGASGPHAPPGAERGGTPASEAEQREGCGAAPPAAASQRSPAEDAAKIAQLRRLMDPGQPLADLSDFAKEYGDDAFCRRLLRKYEGNVAKAAEKFKFSLRWREQHRELLSSRKCAIGGDERVVGADLEGHPMLYTCLKNQMLPGAQCLDQKVVAKLQAIDNLPPGGVETVVHIWDLHGMKFFISDLNPSPLLQMAQSLEGYFAERLQELIIIDMGRASIALKDAIWPLVPAKTKNKVKFLSADQAKEYLRQGCDASTAGRVAGIMDQNRDPKLSLEERRRTWTRVDERGELVPAFGQA